MALTDKQLAFIDEYMANNYNATAAYGKVFPDNTDPHKHAYRYTSNPEVREEIDKRMKEKCAALNITAERILEELEKVGFGGQADSTSSKLKAIDLLQKQLGLQTQKINANVATTVVVINVDEEDGD